MIHAKCGDVLLFGGISESFLDSLENLYNKPIIETQFGAAHTFAIFITKQRKRVLLTDQLYYLLWKPFFGLRWMEFEDVHKKYVRLEDTTNFDKMIPLNIDLGLGELEVKQDHFNKWRGDALTNKLVEYLSRQDVVDKFQHLMQEIAECVENGKYRPKGLLNRMNLRLITERPK